ncbi:Nif3-like dinuclear metal center hexameric protein [Candidatus Caldatribacterium sp.]|uniref:Nif3-like dinuclear metal center hexameric protein n=1 Tax=Candidatus Caldatribacterium sp. TaxID=2282143 RepID=UPI0038427414|nr:Nif3-like dinuclear metal center hexameric protein [Candidatus Caldatribacterium sp.]
MEPLRKVIAFFEDLFPSSLALPEDRVGFHIHAKNTVERVLVALELNPQVLSKALECSCDLLYLHHPPLWEPLQKLSCEDPLFVMLEKLYDRGTSVFVHHTNLDIAPQGIADQWLKLLGFEGNTKPLLTTARPGKYKIVTFVPPTHLDVVLDALFQEGAGIVGNYRDCAFFVPGVGTFLPGEEARPFIGIPGRRERVEEIRIEVEVPSTKLSRAVQALEATHPYEQPVIDVYQLTSIPLTYGLGRTVNLPTPLSEEEVRERIAHLSIPFSFICTEKNVAFQKIALCPGSGRKLVPKVIEERADLFITGDLTHHDIETLRLFGIAYLCIPHGYGERLALREIASLLRREAQKRSMAIDILFEEGIQ